MPFKPVETISAPSPKTMASISYRKKITKTGRSKNPRLTIGIPASIAGDFKPKATQLFSIKMGTGDDAGRARIVPDATGVKAKMLKGGGSLQLRLCADARRRRCGERARQRQAQRGWFRNRSSEVVRGF